VYFVSTARKASTHCLEVEKQTRKTPAEVYIPRINARFLKGQLTEEIIYFAFVKKLKTEYKINN